MKRVKHRASVAMLLALAIVAGLGVFLFRLWSDGADWALYRANQSVYSGGMLRTGTLTDREGVILADGTAGTYAENANTRRACLHLIGDYSGNIGTGALQAFRSEMAGYSFVFGTARSGESLALSPDARLQETALAALGGYSGAVLVQNYVTGEILCIVSTPVYDPADPPASFDSPAYEGVFLNRALSTTYTPGSVFKLVTLAAAIENIPDLYERSFTCTGSVTVGGNPVVCTGWHGTQTIEQALANSCNCVFAELSLELGADTLAAYAKKLGYTDSLTLDGISSAAGRFDRAEAGTSDLAWSGIGQSTDLVCPFAVLRFSAAIAAGGTVPEATLLAGGSGKSVRLLSADTAKKLGDMMSYNVQYAYGSWLFPNLALCAKSGTAEVGDGTSHAWFTGYLDDEKHPYAFAVIAEHAGGGLTVAGAIANTVLQKAVELEL